LSERLVIADDVRPKLPRHAKLRYDKPREKWIILAPERVFELDEIAHEVVALCDGERSVTDLVDALAAKYDQAPRDVINTDVVAMLQSLADKGFIVT